MEGAIRKIGLRKMKEVYTDEQTFTFILTLPLTPTPNPNPGQVYTDEQTFGLLRTYIKQKALLTASNP